MEVIRGGKIGIVWEIGGFGEGDSGTVRDYSVYGELAMGVRDTNTKG